VYFSRKDRFSMEGKVEASWSDNASIQHYSDHVTHRVAFIFCCLLSLAIAPSEKERQKREICKEEIEEGGSR
jgi:hypothetical protein